MQLKPDWNYQNNIIVTFLGRSEYSYFRSYFLLSFVFICNPVLLGCWLYIVIYRNRHIPTCNYSIYIKSHLIYIAFHIASASRRDLFAGNTFNPQHAADLRSAPHTSLPSECGCGTSAKVGRSDQNGSTSRQRGGTAEFGGSADRPHLFCVQRSLFLWRVCCRL